MRKLECDEKERIKCERENVMGKREWDKKSEWSKDMIRENSEDVMILEYLWKMKR
jgi:hypothetical protein